MPEKEERIIARRLAEFEANMRATLDGIKRLAEAARSDAARRGLGDAVQPDGVEFVREAERLGVDSVWVPEFWAGDALTPLAYLAARRRRSGSPPASCSSAPARRRCSRCPRSRCRRCRVVGSCSASARAVRR